MYEYQIMYYNVLTNLNKSHFSDESLNQEKIK